MLRFRNGSDLLKWLVNCQFLGPEAAFRIESNHPKASVEVMLDLLQRLSDPISSNVPILSSFQANEIGDGRGGALLLWDTTVGELRYLIRDLLGKSGQGSVSIAQDVNHANRLVALKRMSCDSSSQQHKRTEREIAAYREIGSHANIARFIHSFNVPVNEYYIVTEFVVGQTLEDAVYDKMRDGGVSITQAYHWLNQIVEGLIAAHSRGVIHRDLKPKNILLESQFNVIKIVDFGMAKKIVGYDDGTVDDSFTFIRTKMGTNAWMPPEQFSDAREADTRSDVFAFGCVAFFVLLGVAPCYPDFGFQMTDYVTAQSSLPDKVASRFELRNDIPDDLADLIRKCVDPNRNNRPHDAIEIKAKLNANADQYLTMTECSQEIVTFRSQFEDLLSALRRDLSESTNPAYDAGLFEDLANQLNQRRHRFAGQLPIQAEKELILAIDELIRNSNLWRRQMQELPRVRDEVIQRFKDFFPHIRKRILEPLLIYQFRS
jgi:serine/threonine protein kinase